MQFLGGDLYQEPTFPGRPTDGVNLNQNFNSIAYARSGELLLCSSRNSPFVSLYVPLASTVERGSHCDRARDVQKVPVGVKGSGVTSVGPWFASVSSSNGTCLVYMPIYTSCDGTCMHALLHPHVWVCVCGYTFLGTTTYYNARVALLHDATYTGAHTHSICVYMIYIYLLVYLFVHISAIV